MPAHRPQARPGQGAITWRASCNCDLLSLAAQPKVFTLIFRVNPDDNVACFSPDSSAMSTLLQRLKSLLVRAATRHDTDEQYLADAVDVYDLERRMRELDDRTSHPMSDIRFGLYSR